MRKVHIASLSLLMFPVFLVGQTSFVKVGNQPVFTVSGSGAWDSGSVGHPTILFDGSEYKMWYWGTDDYNSGIGFATSSDGVHWTKYPGNPVITQGASGEWDSHYVGQPSVVKTGSGYMMWYTGDDGSDSHAIGLATSTDGIHWQKYAGNPVLRPRPSPAWDAQHVFSPSVLYDGRNFHMWYMGLDRHGGTYRIGHAVSSDGIAWQRQPSSPVLDVDPTGSWENGSVGDPYVVQDKDMYVMFYEGSGYLLHPGWQIGVAYSTDGLAWEKDPSNPVLTLGSHGSWDSEHLMGPAALFDHGTAKVWYTAGNDGAHWRIGYAEGQIQKDTTRSYTFEVYPSVHCLILPWDDSRQVFVDIPAGTYYVYAEFDGCHAGGDLDAVFFVNQTGETSTEWPRGHNMHMAITAQPRTITFPTRAQGSLFFCDKCDPNDNYGTATVHFGDYTFEVKPNRHVVMMSSFNYVKVDIPAGTYRIKADFQGAHAGGDLDAVLFMNQLPHPVEGWPRGHNMHLAITNEPIVVDFPLGLDGFLFFVDRADLGDNPGKAIVTFEPVNQGTEGLYRVTSSPNREGWYCWSPDSRYIAYIEEGAPPDHYDNRKNKLHVVSINDLTDQVIYEGVGIGYGYAPDWVGDRIAFIKDHRYMDDPEYFETGDGDIYWIRQDGSGLKRITDTAYGFPSGVHTFRWYNVGDSAGTVSDVVRLFPDLSRVAFIAHDGNGWYHPFVGSCYDLAEVLHIDDSGHLNGLYLARDGSFLLYEKAWNWNLPHNIHRVNSDGTDDRVLVQDIGVSEGLEFAISPNMDRFVFTVGNSEDARDIAVANTDGSGQQVIVAQSADEFFSHFSNRSYQRRDPKGIWSPDGTAFLFTRVGENGTTDIYLYDFTTGSEIRLTRNRANDYDASFSPDGSKIAFISDRAGSPDIWVLNLTATEVGDNRGAERSLPMAFELLQNYPNPFNGTTSIVYRLNRADIVKLAVYDAKGSLVTTLLDGVRQGPGRHAIRWNATDNEGRSVTSGVYLYVLRTTGGVRTGKMVLLK